MSFPLYNGKFLLLFGASFVTIFSSIAIYFCLPILISHIIRSQISLSPHSGSFDQWRLNSVIDRVYLYNITNIDELLNSRSQLPHLRPTPSLVQVGPFTFRQDREKININFDTNNETVLYDQIKRWTYLGDLSTRKTIDELNEAPIYHVNIPLAGTTLNPEYSELVEPIVGEFDLKLFLNHSVKTLLFDGYHDILMEQAKSSGQIDVDKFGWLYNMNNSISKNIRIFTGSSNTTLSRFGSIDQYNMMNKFNVHRNNGSELSETSIVQCNEFRYSSAGEFFPPPSNSIMSYYNNQRKPDTSSDNLSISGDIKINTKPDTVADQTNPGGNIKSTKSISIVLPDICRVITLVHNSTFEYRGLMVDRYIADEQTYNYDLPSSSRTNSLRDNRCFCSYHETTKTTSCPPNGMMDLYNCRKGSPLTISFPHFLYSTSDVTLRPYLKLFRDDVQPLESEHQFYIDLESSLNIPVKAQIVLQFNVRFRNEPSLSFTKDYSFLTDNSATSSDAKIPTSDIYLPQMWIKSIGEIDETNLRNLKFIQKHIDLITPIATIVMFGCASILLMTSAKLAYDLTYGPKSRKSIIGQEISRTSINGDMNCPPDDRKKLFSMQLLNGAKPNTSLTIEPTDDEIDESMLKATTSRISTQSDTIPVVTERHPLNR